MPMLSLSSDSDSSDDPHHPLLDGLVESHAKEWASFGVWERKGSLTLPSTGDNLRYPRLPIKLVLSLVMCTLLVLQALVYAEHHNTIIRDTVHAFWHHFLPEGQDKGSFILKDLPQTLAFIEHTTTQYYRFPDLLPGVFRYCLRDDCKAAQAPPRIKVWYLAGPGGEVATESCALSPQQPRGPFGHGAACLKDSSHACECLHHLQRQTIRIEVELRVITTPPWNRLESVAYKCFHWDLRQVYDLSHNTGLYTVSLHWDYQECTSQLLRHPLRTVAFWSNLLLLLCAVLDIICRAPLLYIVALRAAAESRVLAGALRCLGWLPAARARVAAAPVLSATWLLWALFSDLCTVASTALTADELFRRDASVAAHLRWLLLGAASLAQFVVLGSFLEHDPRLYLLFNTLRRAAPVLAAFIVSSSPVFIAFALFGTAVFGKHSRLFRGVPSAAATLFAVLNGDSVDASFHSTHDGNAWPLAGLSRVYVAGFVCLSIYVVANVCRVIIVEAYGHFEDCVQEEIAGGQPPGELPGVADGALLSPSPPRFSPRGTSPRHHSPHPHHHPHHHHHHHHHPGTLAFALHLLLSVALCAVLSVYCGVFNAKHNGQIQDTELTMVRYFLPDDEVDDLSSFSSHLYTLEDVAHTIRDTVHRYFDLHSTTPSFYEYHRTANGAPTPPVMHVTYLTHGSFRGLHHGSHHYTTARCNLTRGAPLGPLAAKPHHAHATCDHIPDLGGRVVALEVSMAFLTKPRNYHRGRDCIQWRLRQKHDFSRRDGLVPVTLDLEYMSCAARDRSSLIADPSVWASEVVLVASILHLLGLAVIPSYHHVLPSDWQSFHRLALWLNVLWALSNIYYLYLQKPPSETLVNGHRVLLGCCCAMNWLLLSSYLERRPGFRHLGETLRRTLPVAGHFVVGAMPLFGGYCMFGGIFFGHLSYHFASLEQTAVTLFSVLNGDIVLDIFDSLLDRNSHLVSFVSRLYLYTFIPLMFYGLVNIFLVITEESYRDAVKYHGHHHHHHHSNLHKVDSTKQP